jgi:uncharacterized alkaline shock family protein YloU
LPDDRLAGSALVTRRAVVDIVRAVALGSYGVVELGSRSLADRLAAWLGQPAGIRVSLAGERLAIDLRLRVAHGLPIAEVARQLDSAIRFAIRQAIGREVDELSIRIAGLEVRPASEPPGTAD